MNKQEFLSLLKTQLSALPPGEQLTTLSYFSEIIDDRIEDGMSEYEAVASLESIESIVAALLPGNTGSVSQKYSYKASDIITVNIRDGNCPVVLSGSNSDTIKLDFYENKYKKYFIAQEGSILDVHCEFSRNIFSRIASGFDFSAYNRPLIINIPQYYRGRLVIETSNGYINASNVNIDGSLSLRTSNGKMEIRSLSVREGLDAHTSNGKILFDYVKAGQITVKSSNSMLEAVRVSVETVFSAETSNGRINVNGLWAGQRINLVSSNGRIHGSINDSMRVFSISSHTSNGSNSLPTNMPGGQKELHVRTSNGRIDLSFLQ